MRKIFTLILLTSLINYASAQTPNWLWGIGTSGGSCYIDGDFISASPTTDDVYFSGRYGGTITIGGKSLSVTSGSPSQSMSGKISSSGNASWLVQHPYNGSNDYNYSFTRDDSDNTILGGIISSGGGGGYIDKYDSAGNMLWAVKLPASSPYGLTTDKAGNIYVTGDFSGTVNFGTVSITANGGGDMFLAKFSPAGVCLWGRNGGGSGPDGGRGVSVDLAGNVYVCGSYNGAATFGSVTPPAAPGAYPNFFIAKYDTGGTALWVTEATNAGYGTSFQFWNYNGMTIDSCANIYVAGHFVNTATFGPHSITSAGSRDLFVAKCLNSGTWEWAKGAGGAGDDDATGVVTDRYNDVYITGNVAGTASFGSTSVTSPGSYDAIIAKYANSTGDLEWVQMAGGVGGNSAGRSLTIDRWGFIYAIGTFNGTKVFGPSTINVGGCGSMFIVKLDTIPQRTIVPHTDPIYCPGSTVTLPYTTIGSFNTGNTFTAELSDTTGSFVTPVAIGSVNDTTSGNITITIPAGLPFGTKYILRVTSSNPATSSHYFCNSSTTSAIQTSYVTVEIGSTVSLTVTNDTTLCGGNTVQLNASGAATYSWSPTSTLSCSTCSNPVASPTSPVTYTVTAANGTCTGTDSVIVNIAPGLTVTTSNDTTICTGSGVVLNTTGAPSYTWGPTGGLSCTNCSNPTANPTVTTTYTVTGSNGNCSNTDQVVVTVGNTAVGGLVSAAQDTVCEGTPVSLSASGTTGNIQWQLSTTGGFTDISGANAASLPAAPLLQSTCYRVVVANGTCSDTSNSFCIYVPPALTAAFLDTVTGLTVKFNSSTSIGSITFYTWDFGDGATSNDPHPLHTYTITDSTFSVCLTIYDGSNCSFTFCKDVHVGDVGIKSVNSDDSWSIYPNPVHDYISISTTDMNNRISRVEIYDVLGRSVITEALNNHVTSMKVNVASLASGMYYVKITTPATEMIQKVVKE